MSDRTTAARLRAPAKSAAPEKQTQETPFAMTLPLASNGISVAVGGGGKSIEKSQR